VNAEMSSIFRGGRLAVTRKDVVSFVSSVHDDRRIAHATVLVNEAHVIALARARAISTDDARRILRALRQLEDQIPFRESVEDIHVLIEEYVTKCTGRDVGGRLHLAKSRNDQVVSAIRMVLRDELLESSSRLLSLEDQILRLAKKHLTSVFPGYTHLQPAQPISFAHYLLAIGESFLRDNQRILEAYRRVNMSPMGAGALAGSTFNLDRVLEAELLGFDGLIENTLDAVGSRDFALEALNVFSITAQDLSRVAQDIIFYSSADVGILDIPDEFSSTSSIMPQKKNPDPLEIVRAKSAKIVGNSAAAATIMHGLASGYNLDFQEITPLVWDSNDTLNSCLTMLTRLIPGLKLNELISQRHHMQYTAATEIANILVRCEGVPFRTAHRAVGHTVRIAIDQKKTLGELTPGDWERGLERRLSRETLASIACALDLEKHIEQYRTKGSPNPKQTSAMILSRTMRARLLFRENEQARSELKHSLTKLRSMSRKI
jgi:argininosuccinate lyase